MINTEIITAGRTLKNRPVVPGTNSRGMKAMMPKGERGKRNEG